MPLSFTIGNKIIFCNTCSESSKPLLSDQIVLLIERPTFWLKSRKTMKMHRTKHWQTVREQQKSAFFHNVKCFIKNHDLRNFILEIWLKKKTFDSICIEQIQNDFRQKTSSK